MFPWKKQTLTHGLMKAQLIRWKCTFRKLNLTSLFPIQQLGYEQGIYVNINVKIKNSTNEFKEIRNFKGHGWFYIAVERKQMIRPDTTACRKLIRQLTENNRWRFRSIQPVITPQRTSELQLFYHLLWLTFRLILPSPPPAFSSHRSKLLPDRMAGKASMQRILVCFQ